MAASYTSKEHSKPIGFAQNPLKPVVGDAMDVTPFGEFRSWDAGRDIGILWEEMRDVFRVVIEFQDANAVPDPAAIRLQYWQSRWPKSRIPRTETSGSGNSGWLNIGDWFTGKWQDADVVLRADGPVWTYTFNAVNAAEFPDMADFAAEYRSTFKLRIVSDDKLPALKQFRAFTDSIWQKLDAVVEWGGTAACKVTAFNGFVDAVEPLSHGVKVSFWYAAPVAVNSFDETVLTFLRKPNSFSVAARDLAAGKRVYIRDFGVLARRADDEVTYTQMEASYAKADKDVFRRVAEMPEQTLTRAWNDMPAKNRIYMPLCVEGSRQYFRLHPDGSIMHDKTWLVGVPASDTPKTDWPRKALTIRFGIPKWRKSGASIEDGYLPIAGTWWEDDGLRITQTCFATTLSGKLPKSGRVSGEEPQACMVRLRVTNTTAKARSITFPLRVHFADRGDMAMWREVIADESLYEPLVLDGDLVRGRTDKDRVRFRVDANNAVSLNAKGTSVEATVGVPAGEAREFCVAIPFLTPDTPDEIAQLQALKYDEQHELIAGYWRKRTAQGTRITVPEALLNEFFLANASHQLINTQEEVNGGKTAMANVGTGSYGVFANESIMMITELDRRGYHDVAEKALEAFIVYQGTKDLRGDYSAQFGVFTGAGGYAQGDYNQNHGWVLWGMAEHYWYTGDKDWLTRIAPNLVKACDWMVGQRARSKTDECVGIRSIERGLLPQGALEDVVDWRCWLSNNVFSYWGLESVARALVDIGHADGRRFLDEAEDYRNDIVTAFTEATVRAPVVGLRDGTYIPYTPSEVHRRGRSIGWITETLEGGIYLTRTGVIDPESDMATWIAKDYEDNRYISEQYGYQTPFFERDWFSIGGFSQQPSLLCSPIPYMMRDEPKHYLRAFFNAFSAGYFPERAMITEHPLPNLGNWQGGHFKTSDEANTAGWLRYMFIWDEGEELQLGMAIPRYWLVDGREIAIERAATHFGPMSMRMTSRADSGSIEMVIEPPTRRLPPAIHARFRHPDGKSMNRVTVNGEPWEEFDPAKEWVILPPLRSRTTVVAYYD